MRLEQRSQRRPTRLLVIFWPPGRESDYQEGLVLNVSPSGLFIETGEPLPPPTVVDLRFVLDDDSVVDLRGEVVRTLGSGAGRDGEGMGIRFLEPDSPGVEQLQKYRIG